MRLEKICGCSRPSTDEPADRRLTQSIRRGDGPAFARRAEALGGRLFMEMSRQDAFLAVALAYWPEGYSRLEEHTCAPERARLCRAGRFEPLWRAVKLGNLSMARGLLADVPPAQLGAAWGSPAGQEALMGGLMRRRAPAGRAMWDLLCEQVIARPLGDRALDWQAGWRDGLAREAGDITAAKERGVGGACRPVHPAPMAPLRP